MSTGRKGERERRGARTIAYVAALAGLLTLVLVGVNSLDWEGWPRRSLLRELSSTCLDDPARLEAYRQLKGQVSIQDVPSLLEIVCACEYDEVLVKSTVAPPVYAAALIVTVGSPAVPTLIKALERSDADVRGSAAWVLGQLGPAAKEALSPLLDMLSREEDSLLVYVVVQAIGRIGVQSKQAAAMLTGFLEHPESDIRCQAALGLGVVGAGDQRTADCLSEACGDRDERVREAAGEALNRMREAITQPPGG